MYDDGAQFNVFNIKYVDFTHNFAFTSSDDVLITETIHINIVIPISAILPNPSPHWSLVPILT